jgi:hypothetical protein
MNAVRWAQAAGAVGAAALALAAAAPVAGATSTPGPVASWGRNDQGQLGNGGTSNSTIPGLTSFLLDATDISASGNGGSAVTLSGAAYAWGVGATTPQLVGAWPAAKVIGNKGRGMVLLAGGTVEEWGADCCTLGPPLSSPQPVPGLSGITAIGYEAALRADGTVWLWGNRGGDYSQPVAQAQGVSGAVALDPNGLYALLGNGTVVGLQSGQTVSGEPVPGLSNVQEISGNLALLRDGTIDQFDQNSAYQVAQVPDAVAVAGGIANDDWVPDNSTGLTGTFIRGGEFGLVLKADGSLWGAGNNAFGELGNGTTTNSGTPVRVNTQGLPVSQISVGDGFSVATVGLQVTQWFSQITGALGIGIRFRGDMFTGATVARHAHRGAVSQVRYRLHVRITRGGRFAFSVDHSRIKVRGHVERGRRLVGTIRFGSRTTRFDTGRS